MTSSKNLHGAGRTPIAATAPGFTDTQPLPPPVATFTVSARGKSPSAPIFMFLRQQYGNLKLQEVDSVFGFAGRSPLYGGREFVTRELSDRDIYQLNNAGIGVRLPLSNHYLEPGDYESSTSLLRRWHHPGNSVIVTNDALARRIRCDFPHYRIDASVIKNVKTHRKIEEALDLYDSVVLPMRLNENLAFLEAISEKERITLFANAGCALTCPAKLCYESISRINKGRGGQFKCSQPIKKRELRGMVDFPLQPYIDIGFRRFKLLRCRPNGMTGY